ncbi:unnamed protein product [Vitrella brassicaformis CCMP3155]|uniref:Uncharacterized protein n=1 Tax=Vitrella brassicaformis (strain CCMP3155) TaxID=1169540 RepID=A0A0G4G7V2_VITBC|nr:unnamed protein product [Vitrella brassicaformis CCMP3155]|eukprot:CEM24792.1 unnamed protein product [Vitrella brassicaformis CCMP3155]
MLPRASCGVCGGAVGRWGGGWRRHCNPTTDLIRGDEGKEEKSQKEKRRSRDHIQVEPRRPRAKMRTSMSAREADGDTGETAQASNRCSLPDSGPTATHHYTSDARAPLPPSVVEMARASIRRSEEHLLRFDEARERLAQSPLGRVLRFLSIWEPHYNGSLARSRCCEDRPCGPRRGALQTSTDEPCRH